MPHYRPLIRMSSIAVHYEFTLLRNLRARSLAPLALLGAAAVQAQPSTVPLWELGVGAAALSQQAYPGSDEQARRGLALPYLIYRGRVLRADGDGAGLRAVRTDSFELDVSFSGSLSTGSRELRAREGMRRLGTLVEAGPVARWFLNGREARERITLELPLRAVLEARDPTRHRGMSLEPELRLVRRPDGASWGYGLSLGAVVGDRRLASTFYTVAPDEVRPDRAAYQARAGLVAWRLAARVSTQLTPDLRLFAFGRLDTVAGAANRDSPLVRQTTGTSVGLGLTYTLARSAAPARD